MFGQRRLGVVAVRQGLLRRQRRQPGEAAPTVEGGVAADQDQPGRDGARRSRARPGPQRPQARFLEGLLGRVEIAEDSQQGGQDLRPGRREGGRDPGGVGLGLAHPARLGSGL